MNAIPEVFHPSVYPQNPDDSIITEKGLYDLDNFSEPEIKTISDVLKSSKIKYTTKYRGIGLAIESYPIVYKARYILHEIIIIMYSNSNLALDRLAVGLAYKAKGYYYYPESIKFISESAPKISNRDWNKLSCSFAKWKVFSDLAEMCLAIGEYTEALIYAKKSRQCKPEMYAYDYILPGRILKEKNITSCLDYYSKLLRLNSTQRYYSQIEIEYTKAVELSKKGYTHTHKTFHRSAKAEDFEQAVHDATIKILNTIN